jgi:hypothetical protein
MYFIFVFRWERSHCEIAGWGMQEYNNTASYPDSVRAARIKVRIALEYIYSPMTDKTPQGTETLSLILV